MNRGQFEDPVSDLCLAGVVRKLKTQNSKLKTQNVNHRKTDLYHIHRDNNRFWRISLETAVRFIRNIPSQNSNTKYFNMSIEYLRVQWGPDFY